MPDPAADEPPAAGEEALPESDEAADDDEAEADEAADEVEDDELHAAKTTAQTASVPMATGRRNARTIRPEPDRRVSRKPEWPPVAAPLAARWMATAGSGTPPGASPATAPVARVVRTAGTLIERQPKVGSMGSDHCSAARSPLSAARSPQPAARSPQWAGARQSSNSGVNASSNDASSMSAAVCNSNEG